MTAPDDDDETAPRDVDRALSKAGLLLPETEREVERAEASGAEGAYPLPAGLATFTGYKQAKERLAEVRTLPTARRGNVLRYAFGFALGAAAATVVWLRALPPKEVTPLVGGASGELRPLPVPPTAPLKVDLGTQCDSCCAGAKCSAAASGGESCPSGRDCIECAASTEQNVYKLRLSALGLNDEGKAWLESTGRKSEDLLVCADAQGRALGCRSASGQPGDLVQWTSLPVATTTSQLVGGVGVSLRASPTGPDLATFRSAVALSVDTLCRGVAARLALPDGRVVGKVSAFFDDAVYVELARASTVNELLTQEKRYSFAGGLPDIYETNAAGEKRFALVIGPLSQQRGDRIRWQLLDQQNEAMLTFGEDLRGRARPR